MKKLLIGAIIGMVVGLSGVSFLDKDYTFDLNSAVKSGGLVTDK